MTYLAKTNIGRKLDIVHGAGTHIVLYFYAVFQVLRLKCVSIVGVHGHEIVTLKLNEGIKAAVKDTKNPIFSVLLYYLFKAVPALLLRQVDPGNEYSLLYAASNYHRIGEDMEQVAQRGTIQHGG